MLIRFAVQGATIERKQMLSAAYMGGLQHADEVHRAVRDRSGGNTEVPPTISANLKQEAPESESPSADAARKRLGIGRGAQKDKKGGSTNFLVLAVSGTLLFLSAGGWAAYTFVPVIHANLNSLMGRIHVTEAERRFDLPGLHTQPAGRIHSIAPAHITGMPKPPIAQATSTPSTVTLEASGVLSLPALSLHSPMLPSMPPGGIKNHPAWMLTPLGGATAPAEKPITATAFSAAAAKPAVSTVVHTSPAMKLARAVPARPAVNQEARPVVATRVPHVAPRPVPHWHAPVRAYRHATKNAIPEKNAEQIGRIF
ncbi:hypothetical protein JKG47_18100 [Acidithiobacillus sp. MC6.1]|nr:hypothetical protein [Acidithiobacillus sp. MC6.1]